MTHAQIAANARKPYADAIARMTARICSTIDQLAYVYPLKSAEEQEKIISEAIFQLRQASSAR